EKDRVGHGGGVFRVVVHEVTAPKGRGTVPERQPPVFCGDGGWRLARTVGRRIEREPMVCLAALWMRAAHQCLDPGVRMAVSHDIGAVSLVLTTTVTPDQARRNAQPAQHQRQSAGEALAVPLFPVAEELFGRIQA